MYSQIDENEFGLNAHKKTHRSKKAIFICSRVHPGESNSSFVIEGIMTYLLSNSEEAQMLRENFVFKIIPMLNPDGVIFGHYRTSFSGVDLNRWWKSPNRVLHPTIFYAKQLLATIHMEWEVTLFVDIHGHSWKKNIFMYGCSQFGQDLYSYKINSLIKMIPYIFS